MLTIPFVKLDQKTRVQTAISNMVLAGELKELKNNCLGGGSKLDSLEADPT